MKLVILVHFVELLWPKGFLGNGNIFLPTVRTQLRLCDLIVCVGHPDKLACPKTQERSIPTVGLGTEMLTEVMLCKNHSPPHSIYKKCSFTKKQKELSNSDLCCSENCDICLGM